MNFYNTNIHHLLSKSPFPKENELSSNFKTNPTTDDLLELSNYYKVTVDLLLSKDLKDVLDFDFSTIRFLVLDVDGVMTDGGMYYTESGDEFKKFNTKDGMGIKKAIKSGLKLGIISSGLNKKLIQRRGELFGIQHIYVGTGEKLPILESWCNELGIGLKNVAYIGDDINDKPIMESVGFSACPFDAVDVIQQTASLRLSKKGGDACIREFIDTYLLSSI